MKYTWKFCYVCQRAMQKGVARNMGIICERMISQGDTCVVDYHGLVACRGEDHEFVALDDDGGAIVPVVCHACVADAIRASEA